MGNTFNKINSWYGKYIKHKISQEEIFTPIDIDFHTDKIRLYGSILRDTKLPFEDRAKAAHYIGCLAYTAHKFTLFYVSGDLSEYTFTVLEHDSGITTSAPASEYIEDLINILLVPNASTMVKIGVLKGLCGICYLHPDNQNKAKELLLVDILLAILDEKEDETKDPTEDIIMIMKYWVCYLMTVVCCNNLPFIKLFQDSGGQMLEDRLEWLSSMKWFGWPTNYAEVMLSLLGYQPVSLD